MIYIYKRTVQSGTHTVDSVWGPREVPNIETEVVAELPEGSSDLAIFAATPKVGDTDYDAQAEYYADGY